MTPTMTWGLIYLMTVAAMIVVAIYLAGFLTCHFMHKRGWL